MAVNMKKVAQRLLVFFIGVPLIIALVLLLPQFHHLALNAAVVVFTALGALEFSVILGKKGLGLSKIEALVLGSLAPLGETLRVSCNFHPVAAPLLCMAGAFWVFLSRVFSSSAGLDAFISRLASGFSVLVYPGFFLYWLVKMSLWDNAGAVILLFLLISVGNDSAAWAAGMLFGRGNQGIVPASPNKSIAGFIGGIAGSIIVASGALLLFPGYFVPLQGRGILSAVLLGLAAGAAAMLGDLGESAIKRSAGFKDSGTLMLGRGGILDSIDSIALAAPVFYLCYNLLFVVYFR